MSLQETEAECAAVATAPRVSLFDIEASIACRVDSTADKLASENIQADIKRKLSLLSVCILVMRNGFSVIGKSAPASPENFDAGLGRKLAYEDAIRQLWPLMGFSLRDRLHALQTAFKQSAPGRANLAFGGPFPEEGSDQR